MSKPVSKTLIGVFVVGALALAVAAVDGVRLGQVPDKNDSRGNVL